MKVLIIVKSVINSQILNGFNKTSFGYSYRNKVIIEIGILVGAHRTMYPVLDTRNVIFFDKPYLMGYTLLY